jgi:UPF0755 protein
MTPRSLAVLGAVFVAACSAPPDTEEIVRVTIPRGASVARVTDSLSARDVIDSPRWFRLYTKLVGYERAIQAGVYDFPTHVSARRALGILVAGRPAQDRLVLPEGLMLGEIAGMVEVQLGIPAEGFRAAARDSSLVNRVGAREPTLEGYLYPNTYHVSIGATALDVVRQMVGEFEARWRPEWNERLDTLGMTRDELITLASIIEGEAQHPSDLRYVSSVYHNRLAQGMRLEADPTVIYSLGTRRRLFERDYQTQSRYNTYLIDGLPPHPITQPSAATIEAALYPRPSDFLFFVAGPGGRHIFSRTYRDHLAAIRQIRDR